MNAFETLGRAFALLGGWFLFIFVFALVQWFAWKTYKDIKGWPHIFKALRFYAKHNKD